MQKENIARNHEKILRTDFDVSMEGKKIIPDDGSMNQTDNQLDDKVEVKFN